MTPSADAPPLEFLFGRLNYERVGMPRSAELRLVRMRRLLRSLGDPQADLRVIHVAGTKGKGSTAAMIAAALTASGRRTGLFCSPHLHRLEERYRIDGCEITPEGLVHLVESVRPVVQDLDKSAQASGERGPTFFEVTTAIGFLHFARSGVDAAVVEVGMGGRLDSTNTVRPLVSVITSISFDHTRQLGGTLAAIAREKAGILKRGRPAVSGVLPTAPRDVIQAIAHQRECPLHQLGRDYDYRYHPPLHPLTRPEPGRVTVRTADRLWADLPLPLHGPHQAANAANAIATLELLAPAGLVVREDHVRDAFSSLSFPARFEVLGADPWIIIDGAHNAASAEALAATLRACAPDVPRTLLFGTTRDKDLPGQLAPLAPLFDIAIATRYVDNPRSVGPEEVQAAWSRVSSRPCHVQPDPTAALAAARTLTPVPGLICVTGSLFLAAEVRALLL